MNTRSIKNSLALGLITSLLATAQLIAQDPAAGGKPATAAEAARTINFLTFAMVPDAQPAMQKSIASLSYESPGAVQAAFEFQRKQLAGQKWKELPQSYVSDQAASATFSKDGFKVSVSVYAAGKPGTVSVLLRNHGNVDVQKLPVPPGANPLYGGPVSTAYVTDVSVEKSTESVRQLLFAQGWRPYGSAGDQHFFKQNAVRLSARVASAPAQGGKTVIDYSSEQLSTDLPAPEQAEQLQYSDSPTQLFFDTSLKLDELNKFYRNILAKSGWKATTENPIKIGRKDVLIFRNPQADLITLEVSDVDDKQRVLLKFETAEQVAEMEKRLREQKKSENKPQSGKLKLALPAGATEVEHTKQRLEFKLPSGKAKGAVESLRAKLRDAGWKEKQATVESMFGTLSLEKDGGSLSIEFVDPGIIPAEVTISATGIEVERPQ